MNEINKENNKFTWGDAVLVKKNAPECYHPGEFASICGINQITFEATANRFLTTVYDWLYTIEFEDGSSIEVPECYLEIYEEEK